MGLSRFLYIPNIIGYFRILLMFLSYTFSETSPLGFLSCYFTSQFLDMFDGMAARKFNQSTKFGAMLDMVTDRCSTIGLMLILSHKLPQYTILCHIFVWIDICSHWAHMLAQLQAGSTSHKLVTSGPALLQYYYKTKWFMVLLIFGAEGFPVSTIMTTFTEYPYLVQIFTILSHIGFPLFLMKHFINIIQFANASKMLDEVKYQKAN